MGKPIVYCHGCGKSLHEADFAQARASRAEDRPFCSGCRKPEAAPFKPPSTTRRRRTTTASIPVVAPPRHRKRTAGPLVYLAAGSAALLVLLLVAFAFTRSGGSASPAVDPLEEVQRLAAAGADPDRILRACEQARPLVAGTPAEARLREIEGRAKRDRAEREKAGASKIDQALARIRGIVAGDPEFARQAEVAALYSAAMKEAGAREGDVERDWLGYERKLETAARATAEAARAEADRLAAAGDFAGALLRLDRLPPVFRTTAPGKALDPRRREIEERLRISRLPPPPLHEASHVWKGDTTAALSDRALPRSSGDESIPRFTWWEHKGTEEWVTFGFPKPRTVSSCEVYWFDDRAKGGGCRTPLSWKVRYLDGEEWKEVRATSPYGVEPDRMNRVAFDAVPARALQIAVRLQDGFSGGILEWGVPGTDDIPRPPPPPPPPPPSSDLVLDAAEARVQGERIAVKERDGRKYVGNWHRDADTVEFAARAPRAGRYRVEIEYAANAGAGGTLVALFGAERLEAAIAPTGDWKTYATLPLGSVALPAGDVAVRLQGRGVSGDGLMNLRRLRLAPE